MAKENSVSLNENVSTLSDATAGTLQAKKKFIEPEISTPVDVLEATTFFQSASSGGTN